MPGTTIFLYILFSFHLPPMKPYIVIFSSSKFYPVATAIEQHLKDFYTVHPWKGEFFGENKTTPLWTFFKKLFYYDYAIIILTGDHIIKEKSGSDNERFVPKDNVIFELGATMARLGPQKTVILIPDEPKISLPGYFDDVQPYIFTYQKLGEEYTEASALDATREAAGKIKEILDQVTYDTFHSELPAQGLAHAYLSNFLKPVLDHDLSQTLVLNNESHAWTPESGLTVTVIITDQIVGRRGADEFFAAQQGCYKTNLKLKDGRDPGIYALPRHSENDPLHVLDIPTTLLTAEKIIEKIELFWRQKDNQKVLETDQGFVNELKQREIINFRRSLDHMLLSEKNTAYIISADKLPEHIQKLEKGEL